MKNCDEIARYSREYFKPARQEREIRGLPVVFLDAATAPYDLTGRKARAEQPGREEGPHFLTPAQTAAARKMRDRMDPQKFPDHCKWPDNYLQRFGATRPTN
jgi:hypothetical protein